MDPIFATLYQVYYTSIDILLLIPGSDIVLNYIRSSYKNDPFRIFLESLLAIFTIRYLVSKRHRPDVKPLELTEKEINELIEEWEPQSLVPQEIPIDYHPVPEISGPAGLFVTLVGRTDSVINASSFNFLGLLNLERIKDASIGALRKYGVGSCGPPGFYGTLDIHLDLEAKISKFLRTESAILYSQAFSAVSSVIPAFSKRGDIIICDDGIHFPLQKGVQISRSNVYYFKHNDMKDLERVFNHVHNLYLKKPLTRRFVVVEGLSMNHGDICPLPQVVELKERFKYRLIVDETLSIGTLGKRGAGLCDHYDISPERVDIIIGSLGHAFASTGGFCAGSLPMVDHQRLSSQAYCFSASLPAPLATAGLEGIIELEKHPEWIDKLKQNTALLWKLLTKNHTLQDHLIIKGSEKISPVIHLYLRDKSSNASAERMYLQKIVDKALNQGLWITCFKYVSEQEKFPLRPSIRLCISAGFTTDDINAINDKIVYAVKETFQSI